MGYMKCVFKTDCQILARACQRVRGSSYFHTIVKDCIDLFQHFDDVKLCIVYRSANSAAHALEKAAYFLSDCQEWHENNPGFISDVLCLKFISNGSTILSKKKKKKKPAYTIELSSEIYEHCMLIN